MQETLQLLSIMTNDNRSAEAYNTSTDGQHGGLRNMCDVLDKVENRGKAEGANSVALLMKKLFDQNRICLLYTSRRGQRGPVALSVYQSGQCS